MTPEKTYSSPGAGSRPDATPASVNEYAWRLHTLNLVRHLNPLVIAIQQHRGASLALLEGDESFEPSVSGLRQDIAWRLNTLQLLNQAHGHIISEGEWNDIRTEWQGFLDRWRDEGITGNFEFHNRLLDRLIRLIWQVVENANGFLPTASDPASQTPDSRDHHLVVQLVMRDLLLLIENIAMTRGLAVHTAVIGRCDPDHQAKLNHLLQSIGYQTEQIRTLHRGLQGDTLKKLPTLVATLLHEHKLSQLLQLIKNDVILPEEIGIDGHRIFQAASEIIGIYSEVIGEGLDMIQKNLDASLIG